MRADYVESLAYIEIYDFAGGKAHCTGSFVAPGIVLTARHCVEVFSRDAMLVVVRKGGRFFSAKVARFATQDMPKVIYNYFDSAGFLAKDYHENLDQKVLRDVVLLFLENKLEIDAPMNVIPTYLLPINLRKFDAKVVGFPDDSDLFASFSEFPVAVSHFQACRVFGTFRNALLTNCATSGGGSGGPLLIELSGQNYIVGVVSEVFKDGSLKGNSTAVDLTEPTLNA